MSEKTNNRLYLMITITNRVKGATHFIDFYRAFGAPVVFTALGRGTASNDILNTLDWRQRRNPSCSPSSPPP